MVVKSQIKLIKSLQQKKYRIKNRMFVVEGIKMVQELLNSNFPAFKVYTTDLSNLEVEVNNVEIVSTSELRQMSGLKNPNSTIGAFYIPESKAVEFEDWILVLDDIRDPGNLGTIIRLCDWFGIKNLVCSKNTVDCYNPKVLQASMGSITRVNIVYIDLEDFLESVDSPIYGAFMDGNSVYEENLTKGGILVMGNEANGISKKVEKLISSKISIPQFGDDSTESLNVATATAILLNEIRRK